MAASTICSRRDGRCAGRFVAVFVARALAPRPGSDSALPESVATIELIMADDTPRRAANRPSRRQDLIDAAVELLSLQAWEMVTVADIVERAGMTSAAFYYHFSSREQLLE